jgi:hypothetical protein
MIKTALKTLALISVVGLVTGCRVGVAVFEGGNVLSQSGVRDCEEMYTCIFEVNDTNFTETFTAVPKEGYEFENWKSGDSFLCGDSTEPICEVDNTGLKGNEDMEQIIGSDKLFYLIPEFKFIGIDAPSPSPSPPPPPPPPPGY